MGSHLVVSVKVTPYTLPSPTALNRIGSHGPKENYRNPKRIGRGEAKKIMGNPHPSPRVDIWWPGRELWRLLTTDSLICGDQQTRFIRHFLRYHHLIFVTNDDLWFPFILITIIEQREFTPRKSNIYIIENNWQLLGADRSMCCGQDSQHCLWYTSS